MKCPKCQKEITNDVVYCSNCGTKVLEATENTSQNKEISNDTSNTNNKHKSITYIAILVIILLTMIVYSNNNHKKEILNLYNSAITDIENRDWSNAKAKLEEIGTYKDRDLLLKDVNYNYYIQIGDENFNKKNYPEALVNYENAKSNFEDDNLTSKIQQTKNLLEKQELEQKKTEERERVKREQEKANEIADLQRLVDIAFTNVSIQDFGGEVGGVYEFYTYPEAWFSLTYSEKQNILLGCRKYIELTQNVSEQKAQVGVRIKSSTDGSTLATATNIK